MRDRIGPFRSEDLTLLYQPLVDARSHAIIGAEALLRLREPGGTLDGPASVIDALTAPEERAVLDWWVLERVCQDARNWPDLRIGMNICTEHVTDPGFAAQALEIVAAEGLPPDQLEIEVVETGIIDDFESARENFVALRAAGIRIAIDDFGTGYSSLSYLARLPVDTIKIDQSFVAALDEVASVAVIQATTAMARALGLKVTAEGVEDAVQAQTLRAFGCHCLQGFHFSRPVPADAFTAMRENRPW
ncbi:MAG: EAL domain-containing protein [Salinarimonas sp.]|nr:EAL domain-containing protein [Salinarimonas sp.]